ncbi:MAG: fumarylacetoacetase [Pseudomonadota bacterium]
MPPMRSWVASANAPDTDFPLTNLPYGVFSTEGARPCLGVAIGEAILNVTSSVDDYFAFTGDALRDPRGWNGLMEMGPGAWRAFRAALVGLLREGSQAAEALQGHMVPQSAARLHMPFTVAEYTDFYAGKHHALNVGTMFRGPQDALPPNWLHIPIGYNGRASSVVVSGTDIRRPWGQLEDAERGRPRFGPSARFDIELEIGAIVGQPSHGPITVDQAYDNIFGYVLLNDWSARDIQSWEYRPLGPFQAKATATSISPWIVTKAALEPFRCAAPARERELLPYLRDTGPMLYDIDLSVGLTPSGGRSQTIARTNYREMYYSSAQQLAHHTTSGCPMRVGDLLGSGTISGPERGNRGSLLELSWGGRQPLTLDTGQTRSFLEDGDTVTLRGAALGEGHRVGFGACVGRVLPALEAPYGRCD